MLWLRICSPDKSILGKTRLTGGVELHLTFCGTDHCTFNHYPIFFPVTVGVPCVYSFTSGDLFCKQYPSVLQWQRNLGRVVILLCSCLQHNTDKKQQQQEEVGKIFDEYLHLYCRCWMTTTSPSEAKRPTIRTPWFICMRRRHPYRPYCFLLRQTSVCESTERDSGDFRADRYFPCRCVGGR